MRILFVHECLGALAGAEVNAYLTASELKERGHVPGLVHGAPTGQGEASWRRVFGECFGLSSGNNSGIVQAALDSFQPDVVYVHKMADLSVLETLVNSGVPLVRMVHDHDLYCLRSYKYFPLTRNICTRAAGLYCVFPCGGVVSRNRDGGFPLGWRSYLAKQKELRLNRCFHRVVVATDFMKTQVLANGFDPERIEVHPPVPRTEDTGLRSSFGDRNLIVYAGQIIRGKGVDVLLESLARVQGSFECVILGEGSHRGYCEELSRKLGFQDRVRFEGYRPPDELQKFYADASLSVVSSVWPEPFGAVGLEAMRYGLPVVAFDAGGIREWLIDGQNGFLVPWMDRDGFARRIEELLRDKPLARKLGERGRLLAREKFAFEKYISELEAMFQRLMARPEPQVVRQHELKLAKGHS